MALEKEHQKIDAFKRELPLCMQLLHHAIEACKEQLALYHSSSQRQLRELVSCSFNDRDAVVQNECRDHEPGSKRKHSDPLYSNSNDGEQARVTPALGDACHWLKVWNSTAEENRHCIVSFEEGSPWYMHEQASGWPAKPILVVKRKPGGAFVPYNRLIQPIPRPGAIDPAVLSLKCPDSDITGPPNQLNSVKVDAKFWDSSQRWENSSAGVGLPICSKSLSNLQQQLRQGVVKEVDSIVSSGNHAPRKARRSWSPELHQLFVDALQKLGGARATPKQIRELMDVEGLTNDEVKSHLQKYRLHARRLVASAAKSSSQLPGVVSADRAWVSTDNVRSARGAVPSSYDCASSRQSQSCETSITQDVVYCSSHSRSLVNSQASSCCRRQSSLLQSRHSWQGTDVGGEESVGEAARPESSGSKSRQTHEFDELEDHSFSGNQTQPRRREICYEDNENRSTFLGKTDGRTEKN
ncbi:hypothetical protein GOP47_0029201 [Adiantum capillus-veneris]|nr:hypothetical protein GOP47_0029201 [Adiantum capillus-veneris]